MFEKYHTMCDNDLVFEYKKTHNDDLEIEIISRYQKHAKLLAGLLFSKYKFLYQVEFDDIYSIVLSSVFTAIKSFSDKKETFLKYWKVAAINEVNLYVGEFSQVKNRLIDKDKNTTEEPYMVSYMRETPTSMIDDYLYEFELEDILSDPKNKLKEKDIDMFRLFLAGYSIYDIADLTHEPYNKVRYRIYIVKRKIANILFNK